jgi:hypothetical protein
LAAYPDGRTARFIRDTLGMSGDRINRVLDSLIEKGHVVRMEDRLIDRRRPIVTYARVQVTDLSDATIKAGRLPKPDPKVYDIGTGQFVDQKASQDVGLFTCLNVEEMRRTVALGVRPRTAASGGTGGSPASVLPDTDTSPLADKPPVPPTQPESGREMGQESERDTELDNVWIASGI